MPKTCNEFSLVAFACAFTESLKDWTVLSSFEHMQDYLAVYCVSVVLMKLLIVVLLCSLVGQAVCRCDCILPQCGGSEDGSDCPPAALREGAVSSPRDHVIAGTFDKNQRRRKSS